jgi:uncharacterized membrane protein YidH (DUF202 family)
VTGDGRDGHDAGGDESVGDGVDEADDGDGADGDAPDPTAAAARTSLAWRRCGLSLVACGLAIARGFAHVGVPAQPAIGLAVALLGGGLWVLANVESRRRARLSLGTHPAASHGELLVVAGATALAGVVAFGLAVSR